MNIFYGGIHTYMDYINKLIQCLKSTQIYDCNGKSLDDYNYAIMKLVDLFLDIRKSEKRVFL